MEIYYDTWSYRRQNKIITLLLLLLLLLFYVIYILMIVVTCNCVLTSTVLHLVPHFADPAVEMYLSHSLKMALQVLQHVAVTQCQ
jgi:hypothetical protein